MDLFYLFTWFFLEIQLQFDKQIYQFQMIFELIKMNCNETYSGNVSWNLWVVSTYIYDIILLTVVGSFDVIYLYTLKQTYWCLFLVESSFANPSISTDADRPQPSIFEGTLKPYQLKVLKIMEFSFSI